MFIEELRLRNSTFQVLSAGIVLRGTAAPYAVKSMSICNVEDIYLSCFSNTEVVKMFY